MRTTLPVGKTIGLPLRQWMLGAAIATLLVACADKTSSQTTDEQVVVDTPKAEVLAIDTPLLADTVLHLAPDLPPQKSPADLATLRKYWKDALKAERQRFESPRLAEWLLALEDSTDEDGYPIHRPLTKDQFNSLTTKERIAYQMFHPEEFLQNCAEYDAAAGLIQAICRKLPYDETGNYWSERQMAALIKDSIEVRKAVLECLQTQNAASIPLLRLIAELKIKEAIPTLIAIYNAQTIKDDLILTTLMEIMERRNYWKWIYSPTCKSLVISDHNILPLQPATIDTILTFAQRLVKQ